MFNALLDEADAILVEDASELLKTLDLEHIRNYVK